MIVCKYLWVYPNNKTKKPVLKIERQKVDITLILCFIDDICGNICMDFFIKDCVMLLKFVSLRKDKIFFINQ